MPLRECPHPPAGGGDLGAFTDATSKRPYTKTSPALGATRRRGLHWRRSSEPPPYLLPRSPGSDPLPTRPWIRRSPRTGFGCKLSEVQKAVNTARGLYQRWCELLQEGASVGREELDWTTNELRNGLRSIEWDLEDLEETIGIVESNPGKFKLPAGDLQERKVFVERMREAVQEMKDHMVSPAAIAFMERNNREMLMGKPAAQKTSSDLLDASVVSATSRYIEEQQATQQLIMDQQDQQLEMVSGSIRVLKHMSGRVGEELDEQGIMLDAFAHEMDHTQSRMDGVLRKMAKVSHMTSDRRQWCAIVVLLAVLLLVLILLFSL
ncbi:syntaxin-10 isoform X1 [Pteropus vampyrus]|uniref:Syntaxin-10 isoform X1 n=1 Tax=Pteropus vampyrus TaxID=132908 RepID=A0A6P6BZQ7_PTEVA|nr:syntaxin-10 isoform X1 [Pteropus vampyrus]